MTQTPPPTDPYAADEVWDQLEQGLATYLERLHDVPSTEPDRLVLEILSPHGASALPFATVTTTPGPRPRLGDDQRHEECFRSPDASADRRVAP